jgi:hypothetical protein
MRAGKLVISRSGAAIPIKDSGAFGVALSGLGGRGAPVGGQKFTAFFSVLVAFLF